MRDAAIERQAIDRPHAAAEPQAQVSEASGTVAPEAAGREPVERGDLGLRQVGHLQVPRSHHFVVWLPKSGGISCVHLVLLQLVQVT